MKQTMSLGIPILASPRAHRTGHRIVNIPAIGNARFVSGARNAIFNGHDAPRPAIAGKPNGMAIQGLHQRCGPPAVVRRIAKFVPYSVNGKSVRIAISICPISEGLERRPFVANGYPLSPVAWETGLVLVVAPLTHPLPNMVKPRSALSVGPPKRANTFVPRAAARFNCTRSQARASHLLFVPARTQTAPNRRASRSVPGLFDDGHPVEHAAGQIDHFYHAKRYTRERQFSSINGGTK